jgi:predicted N-acetyltransferase YhbS
LAAKEKTLVIRCGKSGDERILSEIEAACFPPQEAAGQQVFKQRLCVFGTHFYLLEQNGKVIGFINGMVSEKERICDEMFEDASLHREDGAWQMIFGLDVLPDYRRRGKAAVLLNHLIHEAKAQGRKGCVLTCKEHLITYYEKFGFINLGISASSHGGAVWYDMVLYF